MKRLLLLCLLVLTLCAVPAAGAQAADIIDSGYCGDNVTWTLNSTGVLNVIGSGPMADYSDGSSTPWYGRRSSIKSVVVNDGVTHIGNDAFSYYYNNLTSVTIADSVTSIGSYAFYQCSGLTGVTIPNGVTSIGNNAFQNCSGLTSVTIPNGVTSIGAYAFQNCSGLTSVTIPSSVTSIEAYVFYGCSALTSVTIPGSVTAIGEGAFEYCSGLTSVSIPDSVASIGSYAFFSCRGLTSVTIGSGVTSIGDYAFYNCNGLTSVTIPDSVTSIGGAAFYGCIRLSSVTIGDSVTSIGGQAFDGCSDLTSVTIPGSVTSIGNYAFQNCSGLTSVTIGSGVTGLGGAMFRDCDNLSEIVLPASVTSIADNAFYHCYELNDIYYGGNPIQWQQISVVQSGNDQLLRATKHYPSSGSCGDGLTWSLDEEGLLTVSGSGAMTDYPESGAPWSGQTVTAAVIGAGVTAIGENAFNYCASLANVTLPASLTSVGDGAFSSCSGLSGIVFSGTAEQWAAIAIGDDNDPLLAVDPEYAFAITSQPQDYTGTAGSIIRFTVEANGDGLTYQWWYKKTGASSFVKSGVASAQRANFTMTMADKYDGWQYYCVVSDSHGGSVRSNTVTIHKANVLAITGQPSDFHGSIGDGAYFTVEAEGDGLTYQWYYNKPGATYFYKCTSASGTTATYGITVKSQHAGYRYYCVVTDAYGNTARSDTVTIYIGSPLKITAQPEDFYGVAGQTINFTVEAQGDSLTYQWYVKKTGATAFVASTLASGTKATYTMKMADKYDGWQYYCEITDYTGDSVMSDIVTVHKAGALQITGEPADFTGSIGETAEYKVTATGSDLTYQWYYKTPSSSNFIKSTSASGVTDTYRIKLNSKHEGYQYYCVVSDAAGQTVQSRIATTHLNLQIISQPSDFTGKAGATISFAVQACGEGLTYQWYVKKTGADSFVASTLASGTKATYTMKMADKYDGWQYYCIVTDAHGNTEQSSTVTVHKLSSIVITAQPVDYVGVAGSTITFTVEAAGDGLSYQWYVKKTGADSFVASTLASGTKATYTMKMADKYDGWQYRCLISDMSGGSIVSDTVTIHLGNIVSITEQPVDFVGLVGDVATYSVGATGDGLTYQWYYKSPSSTSFTKSGSASGKTDTYTITLTSKHEGYQYYCVVTDAYGNSAISEVATTHLGAAVKITGQPSDYTGSVGDVARFNVKATGDGLTYQWYYNKPGATYFYKCTSTSGTTDTYGITLNSKHDGYRYYCVVTDAYGNSLRTNTVTVHLE